MNITTALLLEHLNKSLTNVPEGARTDVDLIRSGIDAYHERVRAFENERQSVLADPMKSELAKREALTTAAATFKQEAEAAVQTVKSRVESTLQRYRTRATPPPLSPDAMLNEAGLGNARSDAAMLLQNVPRDALTTRLKEMAEGTEDAALKHLLLTTEWPKSYLESRGARGDAPVWEQDRNRLLGSILGDEGKAALEALTALEPVAQVPGVLEGSYGFYLRDNRL